MSGHAHSISPEKWTFPDPVDTAALTTVHVLNGALPVVLVTHDADDGMWQLLCGTTNDSKDGRIVCLGCMIGNDPSLLEIADLPTGWSAWRDAPGEPWQREPLGGDD
jgi:hypothetical protein